MNPIFKKLNYKDQPVIVVLNHPDSFTKELNEMTGHTKIYNTYKEVSEIEFIIVFVTRREEIDNLSPQLIPKLKGDAIVWFCYPKGTSKKYKCDFNRDTGWEILGQLGLETVRQVAIDEDWSALRFRKVEFVKQITRRESFALTREAKERTTKKGK